MHLEMIERFLRPYRGWLLALAFIGTLGPLRGDYLVEKMAELGFEEAEPPKWNVDPFREDGLPPFFFIKGSGRSMTVKENVSSSARTNDRSFETDSVTYIGVDNGEFGGGLYLNEYDENKKPFFPGNIQTLIPLGSDLYIIEGIAHGTIDDGSIYVIRDYEKPSQPERITLLPSAPRAVLVEEIRGQTQFVIVTYAGLIIFTPDDHLDIIHHDTFWNGFTPTSIAKYGEYYVIGMRTGIAATKVEPITRNPIRFFVPKNKADSYETSAAGN